MCIGLCVLNVHVCTDIRATSSVVSRNKDAPCFRHHHRHSASCLGCCALGVGGHETEVNTPMAVRHGLWGSELCHMLLAPLEKGPKPSQSCRQLPGQVAPDCGAADNDRQY